MMYSLPILWKTIFDSYGAHIKKTPLWIFVSYKPPKRDQVGVSLDFDQIWVGKDLCHLKILQLCSSLKYGPEITPYLDTFHAVHLKRKHAIRLVGNGNKFMHTKLLMRSLQVLNFLQIKIKKILMLMHIIKTCSGAPIIFANKFTYFPIDIQQISRKTTFH